jgi:5'-methylthioadenosine phosphorylase
MAHVLAIIGGSGIDSMPGLTGRESLDIVTPYGSPSSAVIRGYWGTETLLFLARHGDKHQIAPHRINYRANIAALKMAGATHVVSLSAVGSMRESIHPSDVVVVGDYVDLTRRRDTTFFDSGIVAHVSMTPPICPQLAESVMCAAQAVGANVHSRGTYVCIDGPQFSTRAESHLYRSWNVDVIGMTAMPEAKLAREAELPYATIGFVTDYDCWNESEASVSVEVVLTTLKRNAELAPKIVRALVSDLPSPAASPAFGALKSAIITDLGQCEPAAIARLDWLIGKRSSASEG